MSRAVFLSADWRNLCLINYEIDPDILKPLLPVGTEIDVDSSGKTYVSVVAFMFYQTKIFGLLPFPLHQTFEEMNLRFYVTRRTSAESYEADASSHDRWITEHYWGYTKLGSAKTNEYEVKHPIWSLRKVIDFKLSSNITAFYGERFGSTLSRPPKSVLFADGSGVTVHLPTRL